MQLDKYEVVKSNTNGKAYKMWEKTNGEIMYLVKHSNGRELWTNSLKIIDEQIGGQVKLF